MRIYKSEVVHDLFPFCKGVRVEAGPADGEEALIDGRTDRKLHEFKLSFLVPTSNTETYAYGKEFDLEIE